MKSAVVLSFAVLFGSIALVAQKADRNWNPSSVSRPLSTSTTVNFGCPVSLRAQHGAIGEMIGVDRNRPKGLAQLLHLTLINQAPRKIVAAHVRIHGLTGKARLTETLNREEADRAETAMNLDVKFSAGLDNTASGDLLVPGMTAVLSIDLNSVTFADGSTWTFTGREACHVAPDPLMLIAGR